MDLFLLQMLGRVRSKIIQILKLLYFYYVLKALERRRWKFYFYKRLKIEFRQKLIIFKLKRLFNFIFTTRFGFKLENLQIE